MKHIEKHIIDLMQQAESEGIARLIVGGIIHNDRNEVLIMRRAGTEDFLPGMFELPSGKVDLDESLIEALYREVYEESGLHICHIKKFAPSFDYLSASGEKRRQLNFIVEVYPDNLVKLNPAEHDAYYFVNYSQINERKEDGSYIYNLSDSVRTILLDFLRPTKKRKRDDVNEPQDYRQESALAAESAQAETLASRLHSAFPIENQEPNAKKSKPMYAEFFQSTDEVEPASREKEKDRDAAPTAKSGLKR